MPAAGGGVVLAGTAAVQKQDGPVHRFELSPNCSLTARSAVFLVVSILAVSLGTASCFAAVGFWPVVPFAALAFAGFWAALRANLRRGQCWQSIRIDERDVVVQLSENDASAEYRFPTQQACVELRGARITAWPSRLLLGSMDGMVEVGAFLTESERRRLGARLSELLAACRTAMNG